MVALADRSMPEDTHPIDRETQQSLFEHLDTDYWTVVEDHHLEGSFSFADFADALAFTTEVGAIAEQLWHHPEITLTWGEVTLRVWSHDIDGLAEQDFIFAANVQRAYEE